MRFLRLMANQVATALEKSTLCTGRNCNGKASKELDVAQQIRMSMFRPLHFLVNRAGSSRHILGQPDRWVGISMTASLTGRTGASECGYIADVPATKGAGGSFHGPGVATIHNIALRGATGRRCFRGPIFTFRKIVSPICFSRRLCQLNPHRQSAVRQRGAQSATNLAGCGKSSTNCPPAAHYWGCLVI